MIVVSKVISTSFNNAKNRIIKVLGRGAIIAGKGDIRTAKEAAPFGTDSNPVAGKVALFAKSETYGKYYIIGYPNTNCLADVGEHRIFSTDVNGELQTYIWLKNSGNLMELGGDVNWAVKYTETKEELDKLKTSLNNLITAFNAHTHLDPVSGALPPPTAVPGSIPATANASDFSLIKNDKIKTI